MKTKLIFITLAIISVSIWATFFVGLSTVAGWAQVSANQPLTEFVIQTNPSTNLNAWSERMTFSNVRLNPTNFVPIIDIIIELSNNEDPALIIARRTFTPTAAQMATWYSNGLGTNSAKAWLKAALLQRAGLTEKP